MEIAYVTSIQQISEVANMGESFFVEAKLPGKFNRQSFIDSWKGFLNMNLGNIVTLVEDNKIVGALGYLFYPDPNTGDKYASEFFWYVLPEFRKNGLKLLEKFEWDCAVSGVKRITMMFLHNSMPEKLKKLYELRGYTLLESHYIKELA